MTLPQDIDLSVLHTLDVLAATQAITHAAYWRHRNQGRTVRRIH